MVRKPSRQPKNCPNKIETVNSETFRTIYKLSVQYINNPETFLDNPKTFWMIQKLYIPDNFAVICKLQALLPLIQTIQELPSSSTGFSRRSQAQNIRENSTFFTILFHKFWAKIAHFGPPLTPPKSALFQERGRKRMKQWQEVTFTERVDESPRRYEWI